MGQTCYDPEFWGNPLPDLFLRTPTDHAGFEKRLHRSLLSDLAEAR